MFRVHGLFCVAGDPEKPSIVPAHSDRYCSRPSWLAWCLVAPPLRPTVLFSETIQTMGHGRRARRFLGQEPLGKMGRGRPVPRRLGLRARAARGSLSWRAHPRNIPPGRPGSPRPRVCLQYLEMSHVFGSGFSSGVASAPSIRLSLLRKRGKCLAYKHPPHSAVE